MLLVNDAVVPEHGLRIATGYDDLYNLPPERVVLAIERLGYRGVINHYIGMSHYFALDGSLTPCFHDPAARKTWTEALAANQLCVIRKGQRHAVVGSSPGNRLCLICTPPFDPADETTSDRT